MIGYVYALITSKYLFRGLCIEYNNFEIYILYISRLIISLTKSYKEKKILKLNFVPFR